MKDWGVVLIYTPLAQNALVLMLMEDMKMIMFITVLKIVIKHLTMIK